MFKQQGMIAIRVFWIRILLMLPRGTSICAQVLRRSLREQLTNCRWENWILKARRGLNPAI